MSFSEVMRREIPGRAGSYGAGGPPWPGRPAAEDPPNVWLEYTLREEVGEQAGPGGIGTDKSNIDWYTARAYTDRVKALLDEHLHPGQRVLDIGCGTGKWVAYLIQKGIHCLGIDYSDLAVEKARGRLQELTDRTVIFKADATHLPFEPKSFDAILSFGLLEHFGNHEQLLRHWVEFVKEEGKAIVSVPNARRWDWMFFDILFKLFKRRSCLRVRATERGFVSTNYGYEERWKPAYFRKLCERVGLRHVKVTTFFTLSPLLFYVLGNRIPSGLFKRLAGTDASPRWGLYLFAVADR